MTDLSRYLDRRLTGTSTGVSASYSAGYTTWSLPYSIVDSSEGVLIVARQDSPVALLTLRPAANQVKVLGDYTAVPVFIGVLYPFYFELSRLYVRDPNTNKAETRGRTVIRTLVIYYTDTTNIMVTVTPTGAPVQTYSATHSTPTSGHLRVPVLSENSEVTIEISSTTPGPLFISGMDWDGSFTNRGDLR